MSRRPAMAASAVGGTAAAHPSAAAVAAAVEVALLFLCLCMALPAHAFLGEKEPLRIDVGSTVNTTAPKGGVQPAANLTASQVIVYMPDTGFPEDSKVAVIPPAVGDAKNLTTQARTLRYFPSGRGCYNISRSVGRYAVRLAFAYYNYDGLEKYPAFTVTLLNGVLVDRIVMGQVEGSSSTSVTMTDGAHYKEYTAYFPDGRVDVCLDAIDGSLPILNDLEILPVDTEAYNVPYDTLVMRTIARFNLGGPALGPEPEDLAFRHWSAVPDSLDSEPHEFISAPPNATIASVDEAPGYFPYGVVSTALESRTNTTDSGGIAFISFGLSFWVTRRTNSLYLRYYFCELNTTAQKGERVVDVLASPEPDMNSFRPLSEESLGFDILAQRPNPLMPLTLNFIDVCYAEFSDASTNSTGEQQDRSVQRQLFGLLLSNVSQGPGVVARPPLISGLELFELIPVDPSVVLCQPIDLQPEDGGDNADAPAPGPAGVSPSQPPPAGTITAGSTVTSTSGSTTSSSDGLSSGAIAGIVIGAVVGLAIIGAAVYLVVQRRQQRPNFQSLSGTGADGVSLTGQV